MSDHLQPPFLSASNTGSGQIAQNDSVAAQNNSIASRGDVNVNNITNQYFAPQISIDPTEAMARLAEMPLDVLPNPYSLPLGSIMPYARNKFFVGRDAELKSLARALKEGQVVVVATGIGGVGKTQLATEFVHRYGTFFQGGVFWLNFDTSNIDDQVANCGDGGGMSLLPNFHQLPLDVRVKKVRKVWASEVPRLLIFDNCEESELLEQWCPTTGGCRVLVTSRRSLWAATSGVLTTTVDVLTPQDSIALLRFYNRNLAPDDGVLEAIGAELGYLPLALHWAGSYLATYHEVITSQEYLAELRRPNLLDHDSLHRRKPDHSPTKHELSVALTFMASYKRLQPENEVDKTAKALLARAACFAPGVRIPRPVLITYFLPKIAGRGRRRGRRAC